MRPRWASLLGGFSVAVLLQYLGLGIISRWDFSDRGPAGPRDDSLNEKALKSFRSSSTTFQRLLFGWNTLWSFRHVSSPHEVKNVPPFSATDPEVYPYETLIRAQEVHRCIHVLSSTGSSRCPQAPGQRCADLQSRSRLYILETRVYHCGGDQDSCSDHRWIRLHILLRHSRLSVFGCCDRCWLRTL